MSKHRHNAEQAAKLAIEIALKIVNELGHFKFDLDMSRITGPTGNTVMQYIGNLQETLKFAQDQIRKEPCKE